MKRESEHQESYQIWRFKATKAEQTRPVLAENNLN